jgi:hypothetical protein
MTAAVAPTRADDARIIAVVGVAHACSHFFQLIASGC